jgi:hypothetical protein
VPESSVQHREQPQQVAELPLDLLSEADAIEALNSLD